MNKEYDIGYIVNCNIDFDTKEIYIQENCEGNYYEYYNNVSLDDMEKINEAFIILDKLHKQYKE